ncbi:MAG: hypothetical protein QOE08_2227, partial [Thermoleophilaceae bacterium]|nr:hypothetical protein [Thermoleophilaceae bacterium]
AYTPSVFHGSVARTLGPLTAVLGLVLAPAAAGAATRPLPDLRVAGAAAVNVAAAPGGTLRVSDSVVNRGRATAPGTRVSYYLSTDGRRSGRNVRLGTRRAGRLRPGRTSRGSLTLRLPKSVKPGAYRLITCADGLRWLRESSERNNCRVSSGQVVVRVPVGPSDPVPPDPAVPAPAPAPTPAPADTAAPAVSITSPAAGTTTTDQEPTFSGTAGTAPGDSATISLRVYDGPAASGAPRQTLTASRDSTTGAWSVPAASTLPVGAYTAVATQADSAGNSGSSGARIFKSPGVLLAAGDIASCTQTGDTDTAALLAANPADLVATLGDNAYDTGTALEYSGCYDPTWGFVKAKTKPALGNHEYYEAAHDAAGYFGYFGSAAGDPAKGYYSYDVGDWHVVVLNSGDPGSTYCWPVACDASSAQVTWLRQDLADHPTACTLAYWHHPLFTSDAEPGAGPTAAVRPIWDALQDGGADLVLNGHAHMYERFARQLPDGTADPGGIREIVAGTGGYTEHTVTTPHAQNSEVLDKDTFGVLQLTLRDTGYSWQFLPVAGKTFTDSGTESCH